MAFTIATTPAPGSRERDAPDRPLRPAQRVALLAEGHRSVRGWLRLVDAAGARPLEGACHLRRHAHVQPEPQRLRLAARGATAATGPGASRRWGRTPRGRPIVVVLRADRIEARSRRSCRTRPASRNKCSSSRAMPNSWSPSCGSTRKAPVWMTIHFAVMLEVRGLDTLRAHEAERARPVPGVEQREVRPDVARTRRTGSPAIPASELRSGKIHAVSCTCAPPPAGRAEQPIVDALVEPVELAPGRDAGRSQPCRTCLRGSRVGRDGKKRGGRRGGPTWPGATAGPMVVTFRRLREVVHQGDGASRSRRVMTRRRAGGRRPRQRERPGAYARGHRGQDGSGREGASVVIARSMGRTLEGSLHLTRLDDGRIRECRVVTQDCQLQLWRNAGPGSTELLVEQPPRIAGCASSASACRPRR